jgi:glyoxylase-like metal-dependent hydrolase (beta-lactamase superfamily II)
MGFVWPGEGANPHIAAANETLAAIERLAPAIVIPGHGKPFFDARGSVAKVRAKLAAFERDPAKNARHVVKVMFVFALLDRGGMPVGEVAGYLARIPCYRMLSERFLGQPPEALAGWLVEDLLRAGAIERKDALIQPAMAA